MENTVINPLALTKLSQYIKDEKKIKSTIVVKSKRTGKDITFQSKSVKTDDWGYTVFIGYETGYDTYTQCALYSARSGVVKPFKKFQNSQSAYVQGAVWLLDKIVKNDVSTMLKVGEYHHTGRCIKCGRKLTDLESIRYGMGPNCRTFKTKTYGFLRNTAVKAFEFNA